MEDVFSLMLHLLQTRKLKELLEKNLGWEFQQNSAVDGIYFEEDDEVSLHVYEHLVSRSLSYFLPVQFAPVVEMLDESSFDGVPAV